MKQNRFMNRTVEPTCILRNKQIIQERCISTRCSQCTFFSADKDLRTGVCSRFPPMIVQRGNRHHKDYVTKDVEVVKTWTCNKFDDKRKADTTYGSENARRCRSCSCFDSTLIDLREKGEGRCKKYSPTYTIMKNKRLVSASFEWPHVSEDNYCGEYKAYNE